ncbi:hypothetical protein KUV73_17475 [Mameliella alba]|nr:hypothetical protein [Mameliella alba]MBY6172294.1 hypothetical protein [Mameliella alba]MBY6176168.1 hypothetical protein [Mameliella alba]
MRFVFSLFAMLIALPVQAAEFTPEQWRGKTVLRMTGIIENGDLAKLQAVVDKAETFPHGLPVLLLDSPGGSVGEAMRISEFFDTTPFHTVIPDGARCASACASLVFIGGQIKTVEHFGSLGQHSCSKDGQPVPECNEILAQHAIAHGVSHGSVAAFVTYTPPDELLWFSRQDSDGWGLTRYPGTDEVGFAKSEPRAIRQLTGKTPAAQELWRLDLRKDGYEAFVRVGTDAEREFEMNLFCDTEHPGSLFLSLEIHGPAKIIGGAVREVTISTDVFSVGPSPVDVVQVDRQASEILFEVPEVYTDALLTKADRLEWTIKVKPPYEDMWAKTSLADSRVNLRFAADHCVNGT